MKGRRYDLTEIDECYLMKPFIGPLVIAARKFFENIEIPEELDLKSITVRQGYNTGEIMIILMAENGQAPFINAFKEFIINFFAKPNEENKLTEKDKLVSIYFIHYFNKKGYRKSYQENLLWGESAFSETLSVGNGNNLGFKVAPLAFLQPNTVQAEKLYQLVIEAAEFTGNEIVFDLFCGTGTIGIFCATVAKKVYGIELNESAVMNAKANAISNEIENVEFVVGDVNKALMQLESKPEVIIVDPPRAGLMPETIEAICSSSASKLIYVSCNPTSMARDLAMLRKGGFKITFIQPVDQFCHTYHIECVAKLEK